MGLYRVVVIATIRWEVFMARRAPVDKECRQVHPCPAIAGAIALLAIGLTGCHSRSIRADSRPFSSDRFGGVKAGSERRIHGIRFCWCPPGKFVMGSPPGEIERRPDESQVEVKLTRGLWLAKYEATQG